MYSSKHFRGRIFVQAVFVHFTSFPNFSNLALFRTRPSSWSSVFLKVPFSMVSEQWELCQSVDHSRCPWFVFRTEWRGLRKGKLSGQWTFVFLTQISVWKDVTISNVTIGNLDAWFLFSVAKLWNKRTEIFRQGFFFFLFCFVCLFVFSLFFLCFFFFSFNLLKVAGLFLLALYLGSILFIWEKWFLGSRLSILIFLQIWGWRIVVIVFIF